MFVVAFAYVAHLMSLPPGWSVLPFADYYPTSKPYDAAIAANGAVAVALGETSMPMRFAEPHRLLVVRANGTSTLLDSESAAREAAFWPDTPRRNCHAGQSFCPYFSGVALAQDGTPFATLSMEFEGAYSGTRVRALVWDGAWQRVPDGLPFGRIAESAPPTNVAIGSAASRSSFAYIGNYRDAIPDLDDQSDTRNMADMAGVTLDSRAYALGLGDVTAMRGRFIAGFDARLRPFFTDDVDGEPPVALRWNCSVRAGAVRSCARLELGHGIAYGVDSQGDAVGDDEVDLPDVRDRGMFFTLGKPTLWRDGKSVALTSQYGAAYAISNSGTIVGAMRPGPLGHHYSGFVANARSRAPRARLLDPLVRNLGSRHILGAFGISDDGRILALVGDNVVDARLAILVPR